MESVTEDVPPTGSTTDQLYSNTTTTGITGSSPSENIATAGTTTTTTTTTNTNTIEETITTIPDTGTINHPHHETEVEVEVVVEEEEEETNPQPESSESSLFEHWGGGAMGGGIGQNNAFLLQQQPSPPLPTPHPTTNTTTNMNMYPTMMTPSTNNQYASTASVFIAEQHHEQEQEEEPPPPSYIGGGSITRFAAEAACAVTSDGSNNNNNNNNIHHSDTTYVSPFAKPVPPPPMTFAERSQQAYIKSGSTLPTPPTPIATTATPQHSMVGNHHTIPSTPPVRMMYGVHPIPTTNTQTPPTAIPIPRTNLYPSQPQPPLQQQQQQQPRIPVVVPAAGSYTARSAAVISAHTPHSSIIYGTTPTTANQVMQHHHHHNHPSPQQYGSNSSVMSQQQQQSTTGASMMGNSGPALHRNPTGIPIPTTTGPAHTNATGSSKSSSLALGTESTHYQQKILTDSIRKVQEHAYYMKQAMEQKNLAVTLDRAAHMVGELGGPPHGQANNMNNTGGNNPNMNNSNSNNNNNSGAPTNTGVSAKLTPKNYYDLYMRALEDMPLLEEYLYNLSQMSLTNPNNNNPGMIQIVADTSPSLSSSPKYTMKQLYDCVQYCPRVVSRLYLQIAAGAALIRSGECSAKYVMTDLRDAVRCEQNPVRGLFLRYFLITALRDKLPDCIPSPLPATTTTNNNNNTDCDEAAMNENVNNNDDDNAPPPTSNNKDVTTTKVDNKYMDETEVDMKEEGTVKDSYEFILANFMEMNKLWVRIQHLPGEGKDKEARKRRERERNDLRILVGTNLVRLSQLECVTSKIYGEDILPHILEHIVTTGDPLSQAYLMDCLVQVFPDEYHIETLPILLNVCPRLKDKVNIRTILQGLMDRLAKYLAEEQLLDESDTNQVKISLAKDSFGLFEECVQKVYNARGPKLTSKEVIRLQTALLQYSIKCFPGHIEQVGRCIDSCVTALQQANASYDTNLPDGQTSTGNAVGAASLDDASVAELEKLLSIPLDSLALKVLEFNTYSQLIGFLPWQNRREVAISMVKAVESSGATPLNIKEIEQLFHIIEPLVRDETPMYDPQQMPPHISGMMSPPAHMDPNRSTKVAEENCHIAKLLHVLYHSDVDVMYQMLLLAKRHLTHEFSGPDRTVNTLSALVYATFRFASRVFSIERRNATADPSVAPISDTTTIDDNANVPEKSSDGDVKINRSDEMKSVSSRLLLVLIQETIELIAKNDPEKGLKFYVEASAFADRNVGSNKASENDGTDIATISYELLRLAMTLYEDKITDPKCQCRCITSFSGTILALKAANKENYESLITRTAQFAAKIVLKPEQCQMVAICAHLFFPADNGGQSKYSNPQRALECLQRSLKLADACTTANPACITLFVDLLEHYLYFFEKMNPLITHAYITGLIALINEHLNSLNAIGCDKEAKAHFVEVIRHIKKKQVDASDVSEMFSQIKIS